MHYACTNLIHDTLHFCQKLLCQRALTCVQAFCRCLRTWIRKTCQRKQQMTKAKIQETGTQSGPFHRYDRKEARSAYRVSVIFNTVEQTENVHATAIQSDSSSTCASCSNRSRTLRTTRELIGCLSRARSMFMQFVLTCCNVRRRCCCCISHCAIRASLPV
jgi:hypothetical protein